MKLGAYELAGYADLVRSLDDLAHAGVTTGSFTLVGDLDIIRARVHRVNKMHSTFYELEILEEQA